MLKLERTRSRNISISLRDKTPFLSRSFFYAFGIALGLHLGAVLIFRIQSFIVIDQRLLPATSVEVDISQFNMPVDHAIAIADPDEKPQRYFLVPPLATLHLPKIPLDAAAKLELELYEENEDPASFAFASIEEDRELLTSLQKKVKGKGIIVNVSGELSDCFLEDVKKKKWDVTRFPTLTLSFFVQVEGKSGSIIWYMPIQNGISREMDSIAEQILLSLRFKPDSGYFVKSGNIEIEFRG